MEMSEIGGLNQRIGAGACRLCGAVVADNCVVQL